MNAAISCKGTSQILAIGTRRAHEGIATIDLDGAPSNFVVLPGPSGCGSTTLLYLAAGLDEATSGDITSVGEPITEPSPDRSLIFQETPLFSWLTFWQTAKRQQVAEEVLAKVGLRAAIYKRPDELSGGMRRRGAVARALAMEPRVLLMDEPFAALDVQTRAKMQDFLLDVWRASGASVLFVTHHIDEAIALADRVAVLTSRPGTIREIIPINMPRPRARFPQEALA